jgi:hypothetical protein
MTIAKGSFKKIGLLLALVVAWTAVTPAVAPQKASAATFSCSPSFYWVVDNSSSTQLYNGDPATSNITTPLGPTSAVGGYNAIGYNTQDNFIWGVSTEGATLGRLVRVHADGTAELPYATVPAGLPVDSYQAGAFDESGRLWVTTVAGDNTIYGINVATNTAVALPLTVTLPNVRIIDFAYLNGHLYTASGGNTATDLKTYRIDLSNGNVTVSNPMTGMNLSGNYMDYSPSLWSVSGRIYMYYAQGSPSENGIYEILNYDTANPSFKLRNNIIGHPSGDGASCVTAASPFSIEANDDDYTSHPIQTCTAGLAGNIFSDDTLYGDTFDPSAVHLTLENNGGLNGVTLTSNGNVNVPANCASPGVYTLRYQICDVVSPDVCDTASIFIRILGVSTSSSGGSESSGNLANTGQNIRLLALLAGVLVIAGGGLLCKGSIARGWQKAKHASSKKDKAA